MALTPLKMQEMFSKFWKSNARPIHKENLGACQNVRIEKENGGGGAWVWMWICGRSNQAVCPIPAMKLGGRQALFIPSVLVDEFLPHISLTSQSEHTKTVVADRLNELTKTSSTLSVKLD